MARTIATSYTGANVTLTIGSALIANAFGVSWEVSQNKRPIYGYNSVYYDGIANGQVIVLGQLYLNFQHPQYLSHVLQNYYQEISDGFSKNKLSRADNEAGDQVMVGRIAAVNLLRTYDNIGEHPGDAKIIDSVFANPTLQADMTAALTGGSIVRVPSPEDSGNTAISAGGLNSSLSERNLSSGQRSASGNVYRPDQFTKSGGVTNPLNITITYGDPNLTNASGGITSYMPSSTIILRDVHFIGEAQQVMSDDQPIMETYKFMARSKEVVIGLSKNEQAALLQATSEGVPVAGMVSNMATVITSRMAADAAATAAAAEKKEPKADAATNTAKAAANATGGASAVAKPEQPIKDVARGDAAPTLPPVVKP